MSINGCLWESLFWPSEAFFFTFNFNSLCSRSSSILPLYKEKIQNIGYFNVLNCHLSSAVFLLKLSWGPFITIYEFFGTTCRRFAAPTRRSPPRRLRMPIGAVPNHQLFAYKLGSSHHSFGYKGCPKNIDFNFRFYWACCLETWMKVLWPWLTF